MCRRERRCTRISTWSEESRVPPFDPVNERDEFRMFFFEEQRATRAIKRMWNSNEPTLLSNCCSGLRWWESNLDRALNEECDHVTIPRAHLGANDDGDAGYLRVASTLRTVNAIMIGDCEMGDPAFCSGARERDGIAQ
jgi:hypothetical protein